MGNDWGELEKGGRPRWQLILVLLAILIIVVAKCTPSETRIPRSVTSPDWPKQAVSPAVPMTPGPMPRPERTPHKPTSQSLLFYVVDENVPKYWGLQAVITGWESAKYSDFKLVKQCPTAPCITIRIDSKLPDDTAAEAEFGGTYSELVVRLNPIVKEHREAQSSLAHEFGHLLGAPHIVGTANSVMQPIGIYRILPTALDIETVDRLGNWQLEKMYVNSGKTVDARALPN